MDKQFTLEELHAVVATLRGENGCPWDRAQTHESIKGNTLEEACEVNQAVSDLTATADPSNLCEELGDLLLQVMFHCQIAEENGEFTLEDVIDGVTRKMIRRHPHVFGGETYANEAERQAAWESIKASEHPDSPTPLAEIENVPIAFPALIRSQKVLKKAKKHDLVSFREEDIFKEMLESVIRLQLAAACPDEKATLQKRLGETLFAVSKLAAACGLHSEMALTEETEQFIRSLR